MKKAIKLEDILRKRICEAGGWLSFDAFMRSSLYEPEYGYYESATIFGEQGDYVTSADMGPWLVLGLADLVVWGWQQMGRPDDWSLLEQGGGSGKLMCAVIEALQQESGCMPKRIIEVETSTGMRKRQFQTFQQAGLDVEQFTCLKDVPPQQHCLVFCNELLDAFPARCFTWQDGKMHERVVAISEHGFDWKVAQEPLQELPDIDPALQAAWPDGYVSEWNPLLSEWQSDISTVLQCGYVFCIDYGYPQAEYYRAERMMGTLMAHYKHQASDDVLSEPGNRDITAHVDFTALCKAGERVGLHPVSFISQGGWLAQSLSVQQRIQKLAVSRNEESVRLLAHAKRLLLPIGMGELFKLCIQARNLPDETPEYLTQFDRKHALGL